MPEALVEPCVKAGTSERGVCPTCGAPWERVVAKAPRIMPDGKCGCGVTHGTNKSGNDAYTQGAQGMARNGRSYCSDATTTGWRPTCDHGGEPVPAVCLDPFGGSGTVARVANRLSRRAVLIDLNPDYLAQQLERNRDMPLGLTA